MTPKELYELAKTLGAESYKIKVNAEEQPCYPIKIDYISHGEKIIVLIDD